MQTVVNTVRGRIYFFNEWSRNWFRDFILKLIVEKNLCLERKLKAKFNSILEVDYYYFSSQ